MKGQTRSLSRPSNIISRNEPPAMVCFPCPRVFEYGWIRTLLEMKGKQEEDGEREDDEEEEVKQEY